MDLQRQCSRLFRIWETSWRSVVDEASANHFYSAGVGFFLCLLFYVFSFIMETITVVLGSCWSFAEFSFVCLTASLRELCWFWMRHRRAHALDAGSVSLHTGQPSTSLQDSAFAGVVGRSERPSLPTVSAARKGIPSGIEVLHLRKWWSIFL